ncbi:dihydrofolate reductase family protein [Nonomuraea gerenzanensis]|uniref:Dihydrofolate reductase n=1 Tax=Nonomuraea gerenzanensis TaxID=93944 RepID=A0A1M4EC12_9ACTN|nr:dihydrofolate reductase family protein [Nonomuraea gerenzanensis]UBU18467.1 dihydrofolate reductase family protein [Nonomuraea gerenzanensis]SBO96306.1 Dihydrofolate reductase [Nonomuraea gerenzanensis]
MTAERKIVAGLFISLDGVVEAPEKWHFPYLNEEMSAAVGQMHAMADILLLGRATYEAFAAVWPHQSGELADQLNTINKLVVSTTLDKAEWNNSALIKSDIVNVLAGLKRQTGRNIQLSGSISLTRTLLHAGLIDELRLLVHPIALGSGRRLFAADTGPVPLELTRSAVFSTGVVDLTYRPA